MFRKSITRIAVVTALGLAVLAATATSALADSGSGWFGMDSNGHYGSLYATTAYCNLATHRASFDVWVQQPPQYTNGIYFSDIVYMRDASVNGPWVSQGQVTRKINTEWGGGDVFINQPMDFSTLNATGIAGHYYQFRVYFNWAPVGGYWQGWKYLNVDPFTWIFQNGSPISGYTYCHL